MAGRFEIPGSSSGRPLPSSAEAVPPDQPLTVTIILQNNSPDDLAAVTAFAQESGLQVIEADAAKRTVKVSGSAAAIAKAFGADLRSAAGYISYAGPLSVPENLAGKVMAVLGLDNRPIAHAG